MQEWNGRLNNSSRALFYRNVCNFDLQPYLTICKVKKIRNAFTRLRVASHRLEIEAGRWNKPNATPVIDRKCKTCNVLEDEFHFILECKLYTVIRKNYINKYYWNRPNMQKLISLINSQNENDVRKLALFIYKAFDIRKEHVFAVRNN